MNSKTKNLVGIGLLTAIVVVLQMIGSFIKFGPFSISLVLAPIIIGAALYGVYAGAWLGFVFGVVVLFTDAGAFLAVNVPGTIITCILKGAAAGFVAGFVYKLLSKKNSFAAVIASAVAAPVCNTGLFLVGCMIFFLDTIRGWGEAAGFANVGVYLIGGMVGINFIVELVVNLLLVTTIAFLISTGRKTIR
ncbi:MAG: energy-coupled thiamine transporter ThiT [Lachnospiraceae bacterium]|nr:energy-coupled thiamine transporter ThiT [Lachnospiraceae bacterium]